MFCLLLFFSTQGSVWPLKKNSVFRFENLNGQFTSTLRIVILELYHTYSCPGENPERRGSLRLKQSVLHQRGMAETIRERQGWEQLQVISLAVSSLWWGCAQCPGGCDEMPLFGLLEAVGLLLLPRPKDGKLVGQKFYRQPWGLSLKPESVASVYGRCI